MAFPKYVREVVLGINGGDLSAQVESALAEKKIYEAFEATAAGTGNAQLRAEFRDRVFADPLSAPGNAELAIKWKAFLEETKREELSMAGKVLPKLCMSEAGITHVVMDCRMTRCGWHWSRTVGCSPVEDTAVTCRKCAGSSVRWA